MASVTIYTKNWCPYCMAAKDLLNRKGVPFTEIEISGNGDKRNEMIARARGRATVPQVFIGERHLGGCDDLYGLEARGELDRLLAAETRPTA
jgi:glutaredoxin 3